MEQQIKNIFSRARAAHARRLDALSGARGGATARVRWARIVAAAVIVAAGCAYLDLEPHVFDSIEQPTYDLRLEVASGTRSEAAARAQKKICVIGLSDATYRMPTHGGALARYMPRGYYAQLVREMTHDGAAAVGFDLLFDAADSGDPAMAAAIRQSGRVVLGCGDQTTGAADADPVEPMLLNAGAHQGHVVAPLRPGSAEIDRALPIVASTQGSLPSLSVEVVRVAQGQASAPLVPHGAGWQAGQMHIPVNPDGTFHIFDFGDRGNFQPVDLTDVISPGGTADFFRASGFFRNKIVLVGDLTRIGKDIQMTPLGQMPGVLVQANAVATLLYGPFLRDAPPWVEVVELMLLAAAAALIASVWPLRRAAVALTLMLPLYFVFNTWLFVQHSIVLHLFAPSLTVALTALAVLLERGLTEEQEKTRMRALLHRYVSPQIAGHLIKNPGILGQPARRTVGTALFSDIRSFTPLSEQMPPEELVARLNEYFDTMTEVVLRHDGTVASIVGDGMLALFGIPLPCQGHACQAIAAAIEMQDALQALQERWRADGRQEFDIGIGINTGEMVAGDVGGRRRAIFTAYGLHVNIASRVESLNKTWNSRILITRAAYDSMIQQEGECRIAVRGPLKSPLKGVEGEIEIFEVLGWKET